MGRYRARNTDPIEREVHRNISEAERYLKRALSALRSVDNSKVRTSRYNEMERLLRTTLSQLSSPPKMVASYDTLDPDLNPSVREQRRKEREELRAKRGNK